MSLIPAIGVSGSGSLRSPRQGLGDGQQVKGLASKPDNLSSISRTHAKEKGGAGFQKLSSELLHMGFDTATQSK